MPNSLAFYPQFAKREGFEEGILVMKNSIVFLGLVLSFSSFAAQEKEYEAHCSCQVVRDFIIETQDYVSATAKASRETLAKTRTQHKIKKRCLENLGVKPDARSVNQVLLSNCSKPASF